MYKACDVRFSIWTFIIPLILFVSGCKKDDDVEEDPCAMAEEIPEVTIRDLTARTEGIEYILEGTVINNTDKLIEGRHFVYWTINGKVEIFGRFQCSLLFPNTVCRFSESALAREGTNIEQDIQIECSYYEISFIRE